MDTLLIAPAATAFDAVSSIASAGIYVIVGLAALAHAPRDARVRVFLTTALAAVIPYCVTAQIWAWGAGPTFSKRTIVLLALSLMTGSLALFHFTQIFPWRRPWIRAHAATLWAGYVAVPLLCAMALAVAAALDDGMGGISRDVAPLIWLALAGILLPVVFVLGVVVPFGGLWSLYKNWQTASKHGIAPARITTWWMLVSQMGGGVLTIVIVPLLHFVAPRGPLAALAAALLFASAVLMPLAFAVGVWKLDVLKLDIDALPQ